jgi:pre-mRNA cleavage complex 2 protein Pcf11
MSLSLKLTTADMQRDIPLGSLQAINFKELPLQCRQCANRYPSSAQGQASMDQHLDWHFRQNRRAKDSAVRGQSRSWFSRLEDWIRGGYDDDSPSSSSDRNDPGVLGGSGGRTAVAMTPAQELELKAATNAFVVAPSDDPGVVTKPCPICKELFKSEWSEDEEEWIWKNAVKVGEVYYHGSCHYSAKTISTSVKQQSSDSREGTPLADALLSPKPAAGTRIQQIKSEEKSQPKAPAAGVKRKAEDEGEGGSDAESAPPKMLKPSTATVKEEP